MKQKMPWLKTRLRDVGKTPAALARELKIAPPRVYEMIAGRRGIQPDEIAPTARFLDWPVQRLLGHLPPEARVVPTSALAVRSNEIPVLATIRELPGGHCKDRRITGSTDYDCVLTGETSRYVKRLPAFDGRTDISCLYLHSVAMVPWRDPGELIVFERERPPHDSDHVVIWIVCPEDNRYTMVVVRQLVLATHDKLRLRQHSPAKEYEIDRELVGEMFRVMNWDDCLR